jgi:hypothetical protein
MLAVVAAVLVLPASAAARLPAPRLLSPAAGATFQELPAITWAGVRRAAQYEYEISADPLFRSILGTGPGKGTNRTYNLAAALDRVVPDGTYWWRVRALTSKGNAGRWSHMRAVVKRWTIAPQILGGDGASIFWPMTPLVLRWSTVPYAVKFIVTIATDPALSNPVLGTPSMPQYTDGTNFVLPGTLANGAYYWAVTPVDAEGHRGTRSRVGRFTWTWPTGTTTGFINLSPDPRVVDPFFSWNQVPGAARYEVEINQHPDFPAGSKWCCTTPTIGTSLAPQHNLANNSTYWWRMRAIDADGHAGDWNYGGSFTQAFDAVPGLPSIPNLTMSDPNRNPLRGVPASTDTPIVTWDPVPGASRYELQLAVWNGSYCDFSAGANYHAETETTAWTPLGVKGFATPGPRAWPMPQVDQKPPVPGHEYCVRVLARSDNDAQNGQVVSDWTYINAGAEPDGGPGPAFDYLAQPAPTTQPFEQYVQSGQYILPAAGSLTSRTPLFTWGWLPGARAYWVVIARDPLFTDVADLGLTDIPAYAPRLANAEPLADKQTSYYWAVIPAPQLDGSHYGDDNPMMDHPSSFNKSSSPPTLVSPANGANVSTWPTFSWTNAENARNYTLQVSQDPSFGKPIDNVTTDATAYTSSSTYPADAVLYWRVRANDWIGQGLNWSPVQTFTRRLPESSPAAGNPTEGGLEPVLSWLGVAGAVSYDVHIEQGDGTTSDFTVDSTAFAPTSHRGIGRVRWQVRPLFPTSGFSTVGGGFFAPQPYLLKLGPPAGARGFKSGSRLVISWNPDPAAKSYEVDVSTDDSFATVIDSHRADGTSWAPDINYTFPGNRGRLYWRVAAVSTDGISVGSFATGSFLNGSPPNHHRKAKHRRRKRH